MTAASTAGPPRFQRSRLRLGLVLAVIAGALAFLLLQGLGNATLYFRNADEAVAQRDSLGTRPFRLQGTVVEGTVREQGDAVAFDVEHAGVAVAVRHSGDPPELFQPGIPVVLEGRFAADGSFFRSDRIMVRHTSEYREEHPERVPGEAP
jgi:cytochrome c-type biogenesis protein CcmE